VDYGTSAVTELSCALVEKTDLYFVPRRFAVAGGRIESDDIRGPIIRNRTHFFAGYEGTRRKTGSSEVVAVPSQLQRQGDFSQTHNARGVVIPIFDPLSNRQPFAGNVIPSNRIDSISRQFVPFWPRANRPPTNVAGAQNFAGNRAQVYTRNNVTGRVDHVLSNANRLYFRFVLNYAPSSYTTNYPDIEADPNATSIASFEQNFLFADTHTFPPPRLIMDLRYTFGNRKWHSYIPASAAKSSRPWGSRVCLPAPSRPSIRLA
jgi:hypothetical protein